jgi:hypothetical protein
MVRVPNEEFPTWWRGASHPPPAAWKYTFELFTDDVTGDEWALAAAIFVAQYRRRNSCGPTYREVFEHLLDDTRGVPGQLPLDWDKAERRRANGGFRGHVMLDWRRRGFIGFDRHVTRSLRVGPHFRERSRQLRANTKLARRVAAEGRTAQTVEPPLSQEALPASTASAGVDAHPHRRERDEQEPLDTSLTTEQVMARLHVTNSYLNRLRKAGYLHTLDHDGELRYPGWQFSNEPSRPVVPGIDIVAMAIPENWTLAAINAFMQAPQTALSIEGRLHTPAQWLDRGGDPMRVAEILHEIGAQ